MSNHIQQICLHKHTRPPYVRSPAAANASLLPLAAEATRVRREVEVVQRSRRVLDSYLGLGWLNKGYLHIFMIFLKILLPFKFI